MNINAKTTEVVTGITLELSNDDATHLLVALKHYRKFRTSHSYNEEWPWLDKFISSLDEARGVGYTMGRRARK